MRTHNGWLAENVCPQWEQSVMCSRCCAFLRRKWAKELDYRLKKRLWSFRENRISVCFEYEWHDDGGFWYRAYGNENWEFAENGLMMRREASINDVPIKESERKFLWERKS